MHAYWFRSTTSVRRISFKDTLCAELIFIPFKGNIDRSSRGIYLYEPWIHTHEVPGSTTMLPWFYSNHIVIKQLLLTI